MKGFPRLLRAAVFSCFLIIFFSLVMLMAGCSPSSVTRGGPTPTPSPGNAFVYTANAGGNSVSGFANDGTGALTAVPGSPFAVAGEPFGLAATPNNQFLYVTSFQNNQVSSFSISPTSGVLTPLTCPTVATTDVQPLKITINPAGTLLYTANQVGSVTGFTINTTTGCLTAISTTLTDATARGITIDQSGQFVYVVTAGGGIDAFQIGATGTLTRLAVGAFDSGTTTMLAVKAVPTFEVLVATDGGSTNNLRTFVINTDGSLTPIIVTPTGSSPPNPSAIAFNTPLNATTPLVYIANTASNNLTVNTVNNAGTTGTASLTVPAGTGPIDLAVDPSGKFLYVANNGSSTVSVLNANITAANTTTALISTSPTGGGPESIVVVGHP
ncbi:MAG: lactonase family protein [Acidobacteriia bacterium]|nr:lactonase family protein [Terriglobia bacterium]